MAGAGTLINTGALTFFGGGTGLANVLSVGAVGSAIGLGLAAYAITRPQEKKQSSGYHKRQGNARQGGPKRKGKVNSQGIKVSGGKVNAGKGWDRQVSEGRADEIKLSEGGSKVSTGNANARNVRGGQVSGGRAGGFNVRQGPGRQSKQNKSGPSRPVKVISRGKVGRQGSYRTKREQKDFNLSPLDAWQFEEQLELQETLEIIRQHDKAGCGKRLMCELAGMNQEELSIEELSILNLVSYNGNSVLRGGAATSQASLEYLEARTRGQSGEYCGNVYPLCTLNGKQLMNIVNEYLP